ncbi:MAG: type IV pilus modification PilV family protein [Planctomycetota bacterium]|jgi:Tfp pilus assembly protein PilV
MAHIARPVRGHAWRRGFTLMEALMAASILLAVVLSVTTLITAGQQHAYEAHSRIAGTLAAEELLDRLSVENYAALSTWNGYTEAVGTMTDADGAPMPPTFAMVGRDVTVTTVMVDISSLGVLVRGAEVQVRTFDDGGRVLADVVRFIPEPPEDSLP